MIKKIKDLKPGDCIHYEDHLEVQAVYKSENKVYAKGVIDGRGTVVVEIDLNESPTLREIDKKTRNEDEKAILTYLEAK